MFIIDPTNIKRQCVIGNQYQTPLLTYFVIEKDSPDCMLLRTLEPGEYMDYYRDRQDNLYILLNSASQTRHTLLWLNEGSKEEMEKIAQDCIKTMNRIDRRLAISGKWE